MLARLRGIWIVLFAVAFLFTGCENQQSQQAQSDAQQIMTDLNKPLAAKDRKRVLILSSYHAEYVWDEDVKKGILRGLAEERFTPEKNIIIEYFYMDTKRKTGEQWKREIAQQAMEKINSWQPDVVIATDDNAQKYVVAEMKDSGVNFVFLGVNADPMAYNYINSPEDPGGTITGSIERARFEQSMRLLKQLQPDIKKVAIISDDSPTGKSVVERILQAANNMEIEVVSSRRISRFSDWKNYVRSVQDYADALLVVLYFTLKDEQGNSVSGDEVLNWTINNSKLPDVGFWSWAVGGGLLCSEAISGYQQGFYAATVASYVLMGQKPGDFPVDKPQRGEICINMARAEMLGLDVPADIKRTATVYSKIGSAPSQ
ncbi:MAG: ABC transporter substrate binding protein [Desulfocapsaceae bacterium]|nr:ABC transporter substrate binding protein [Desulfocapsaceae bacterium]